MRILRTNQFPNHNHHNIIISSYSFLNSTTTNNYATKENMKSEPNTLQSSHDSTSRPTQNQHVQLGAFAVTLLLSDHKVFGFSER